MALRSAIGTSLGWPGGREPDGEKQAVDVTLNLRRSSNANSPRKEYCFDLQDDRGQIGITGVRCSVVARSLTQSYFTTA